MAYSVVFGFLSVECSTVEEVFALVEFADRRDQSARSNLPPAACEACKQKDATIAELQGKLNALHVASRRMAKPETILPAPAKRSPLPLADAPDDDDTDEDSPPAAVTPRPPASNSTEARREQIAAYLANHGPQKPVDLCRLFSIPEGSIGHVLRHRRFESTGADRRYRLVDQPDPEPDDDDEQDDDQEAPPPVEAPPITGRLAELLRDSGPLTLSAIVCTLATPVGRIQEALLDPQFAKVDGDRWGIVERSAETIANTIADYLRSNGPTRYGFIASALSAAPSEVAELLARDGRFAQRHPDGAWYLVV